MFCALAPINSYFDLHITLRWEFGLPHKLYIYPVIQPPRKYKMFLSNREVVAGALNTVKFIVKNIGKETFPGGKLSEGRIYMEFFLGISSINVWRELTIEIPKINPNETFSIKLEEWSPYCPGLWRISMKILPKDDEQIEYYQAPKAAPNEEEWVGAIYSVDRHQLDLTLALERLRKRG